MRRVSNHPPSFKCWRDAWDPVEPHAPAPFATRDEALLVAISHHTCRQLLEFTTPGRPWWQVRAEFTRMYRSLYRAMQQLEEAGWLGRTDNTGMVELRPEATQQLTQLVAETVGPRAGRLPRRVNGYWLGREAMMLRCPTCRAILQQLDTVAYRQLQAEGISAELLKQHARALAKVGLIQPKPNTRRGHYRLKSPPLGHLRAFLNTLAHGGESVSHSKGA